MDNEIKCMGVSNLMRPHCAFFGKFVKYFEKVKFFKKRYYEAFLNLTHPYNLFHCSYSTYVCQEKILIV